SDPEPAHPDPDSESFEPPTSPQLATPSPAPSPNPRSIPAAPAESSAQAARSAGRLDPRRTARTASPRNDRSPPRPVHGSSAGRTDARESSAARSPSATSPLVAPS